jgi:hypothetical protein
MPRVAITRAEADSAAYDAAYQLERSDLESTKSVIEFENLGLYRWSPDPWNVHVDDTQRDYFYWVYEIVYEVDYYEEGCAIDRTWYLVGTAPKGGAEVTPSSVRPDVEVEYWENDRAGMFDRMREAVPEDLKEFGMADIEVLVIFSQ